MTQRQMKNDVYSTQRQKDQMREPSPDDVETAASDIQLHDQQDDASDDSKQVQECDTADSDISDHLSDHEDVLTFFRGIQTSRGQMVRDVRLQMWTIYCVEALSLPYKANETTDEDIVLARTRYGIQ